MKRSVLINKLIGETPLEALERYRSEHPELSGTSMTYAGRLDPMAEGELLILFGEECKKKDKYLGLDKEYEIEVVFGIRTDTHDALGMAEWGDEAVSADFDERVGAIISLLQPSDKKVVTFTQEYPAYSSKTVGGVQLHALARVNNLPAEMPTKEVKIYELDVLHRGEMLAVELRNRITKNIGLVKGDFRQTQILDRWQGLLEDDTLTYPIIGLRVKCSSGTYMRSFAHKLGQEVGTGAFALSIKRTKIFLDNL